MKTKYSMGLLIFSAVMIYLMLTFLSGNTNEIKNETDNDLPVNTQGKTLEDDCFYLYEINGYVVVFESDKETPYEYTDIVYEELPYSEKNEIKNGKYIENKEELYGFLENYSS